VKADLPDMLAEKTQLLADQTPRCQLTRTAVDLADPRARDAFFDESLDGTDKALVLTDASPGRSALECGRAAYRVSRGSAAAWALPSTG
jgi:hypothetical protein